MKILIEKFYLPKLQTKCSNIRFTPQTCKWNKGKKLISRNKNDTLTF